MGIVGKLSKRLWLKENDKESKSKDCGRSNPVALERYSCPENVWSREGHPFSIYLHAFINDATPTGYTFSYPAPQFILTGSLLFDI